MLLLSRIYAIFVCVEMANERTRRFAECSYSFVVFVGLTMAREVRMLSSMLHVLSSTKHNRCLLMETLRRFSFNFLRMQTSGLGLGNSRTFVQRTFITVDAKDSFERLDDFHGVLSWMGICFVSKRENKEVCRGSRFLRKRLLRMTFQISYNGLNGNEVVSKMLSLKILFSLSPVTLMS